MTLTLRRFEPGSGTLEPRGFRNLLLIEVGQNTVAIPADLILGFSDEVDPETPALNLAKILGLDPVLTVGRKANIRTTRGDVALDIGLKYRLQSVPLADLFFPPNFIRSLTSSAVNLIFHHDGRVALHLDVEHLKPRD